MSKHESNELIGTQLGDYTLLRVLATGGMAQIYEAEDRRLGRRAAVKVLGQEKLAHDATLTARFQREARAVAALEHDNIITIYQYGEQDGVYFLAMKLVKGKDLAQELSKLRRVGLKMDVERGLFIIGQVAAAIDYAHQHQVVHRDIKPSNILLDKNDKAILTDFGLVMQPSGDSTLGTAFGTPRYIAPEQAISSSKAVPQSDIYSLCVILYEVLTGQTPFNGDTPMEIALSHINDAPPSPRSINPSIPEDAEREILRALDKTPENRHASAMELVNAVKRSYGLPTDSTASSRITDPMPDLSKAAVSTTSSPAPSQSSAWDDWSTSVKADASSPRKRGAGKWVLMALILFVVTLGGVFLAVSSQNRGGQAVTPTLRAAQTESLGDDLTATEASKPTVNPASRNFASIKLLYNENAFVMVNQGSYTLNVLALNFRRGEDGGGDDYAGDRISGDILPGGTCFRIQRQNRPVYTPPECSQVHGSEYLLDPAMFFWRTEPIDATAFDVLYEGEVIASCKTVARGEFGDCAFNWTVSQERAAMGD